MFASLFGVNTAKVLEVLVYSKDAIHLSEIARRASIAPIEASRALDKLVRCRLVERKRVGNQVFFSLNLSKESELLRMLVEQSRGVIPALRERLSKEKKVELAFVYGSFASGTETVKSDVDVIIVGGADWASISQALQGLEAKYGREINYSVFSLEEFHRKKKTAFLSRILSSEKIMLVGGVEKLEKV